MKFRAFKRRCARNKRDMRKWDNRHKGRHDRWWWEANPVKLTVPAAIAEMQQDVLSQPVHEAVFPELHCPDGSVFL